MFRGIVWRQSLSVYIAFGSPFYHHHWHVANKPGEKTADAQEWTALERLRMCGPRALVLSPQQAERKARYWYKDDLEAQVSVELCSLPWSKRGLFVRLRKKKKTENCLGTLNSVLLCECEPAFPDVSNSPSKSQVAVVPSLTRVLRHSSCICTSTQCAFVRCVCHPPPWVQVSTGSRWVLQDA